MPVAIRLKAKYLDGGNVKKQKSPGGNSGKNKHTKLNASQKRNLVPQPKRAMYVDGLRGTAVMRLV